MVTSAADVKGVVKTSRIKQPGHQFLFPKTFHMTGEIVPSERRHGLYRVTVYELRARIEADYLPSPTIPDRTIKNSALRFALTDVRGTIGSPSVTVNGVATQFRQGVSPDGSGAQRSVLFAPLSTSEQPTRVSMEILLGGTQQLSIAPIADLNKVLLRSTWRYPLFSGRFLPRNRSINANGFEAEWDISSLATSAQQQAGGTSLTGNIDTFDISLNQPSDPYMLSERATKYGVLFVLLTFAGFFVFEVMKQLPIHPVQYLLVGFALALFFLLLISFSEHVPFGLGYLIASSASIGLLSFYLSYVLRSVQRGLFFGSMITGLFAAIYGLLRSEDNALLLGSLLLFAILAVVMTVTRHVDWYRSNDSTNNFRAAAQIVESIPGTASVPWRKT